MKITMIDRVLEVMFQSISGANGWDVLLVFLAFLGVYIFVGAIWDVVVTPPDEEEL